MVLKRKERLVLRMVRRAIPLALLLALVAHGSALAATVDISIVSSPFPGAYSPATAALVIGDTARWTNTTTLVHSATGDSPLNFWDTGTFTQGQVRTRAFTVAGGYAYHCSVHSQMHGTVNVKMTLSPTSGIAQQTVFTLTWASAAIPNGFNVDVQFRRNGGAWTNLVVNRTGTQTSIQAMAPAPGTYDLRARIQRTSNGAASAYSPPVTGTVS
jgi:plastocyanin